MPLPSPTQHLAPDGIAFDQIAIIGPIDDQRPIPEDLNHVISAEPSSCDRPHYCAPALSTPHPTRSGFYFVGDFGHRTEELGDIYTWQRRWATIPRSFTRALGTYAYRVPGLPVGAVGSAKTITAMSPAASTGGYVASPVFTSAGHGLAVGARLNLVLNYSGTVTPVRAPVTVTAVTTDTFTTTGVVLFYGAGSIGNFSSGTATEFTISRAPKTLPLPAIETLSYALPGVTPGIATADDFRADEPFQPIIAATGEEVDTLDASTSPTATAYREQIAAGGYLVAESAVRLYLGQILERRTVSVRAT